VFNAVQVAEFEIFCDRISTVGQKLFDRTDKALDGVLTQVYFLSSHARIGIIESAV
jgi:hypothetical protein